MKSLEDIRKIVTKFNVKPRPEMRSKVLDEALEIQRNQNQQSIYDTKLNVWRIIMKSRITKFAAAAGIIVAVFIGFNHFGGSIDPASMAFASVEEVMKREPWMHISITSKPGQDEMWVNYNSDIFVLKKINGQISYFEGQLHNLRTYDPCSNTITLQETGESDLQDFGRSPIMFCDGIIAAINEARGNVEKRRSVIEDKPVLIYSMSVPQHINTIFEMAVDEQQNRPLYLSQITNRSENNAVQMRVSFDYPESGPENIYDAGAPKNAKVIDATPLLEIKEFKKLYNGAAERAPSNYLMLVAYRNRYNNITMLKVIYNKNKAQRVEGHSVTKLGRSYKTMEELLQAQREDMAELGTTFDSMLEWAGQYKSPYVVIHLYDGKYGCKTEKPQDGTWKYEQKERWKNSLNPNVNLVSFGWPAHSAAPIKVLQNEYAKEHGLMSFETQYMAQVREGKLIFPAEKTIYYIDPKRDYMCVREEMFWNNTYRVHEPRIETLDFDPNIIPDKFTSLTEVKEFGKTDQGQWYPKRIEHRTVRQNLSSTEFLPSPDSVEEIYLNTEPNFPEGIFDCDKLPH
jgi:hypothetical protein